MAVLTAQIALSTHLRQWNRNHRMVVSATCQLMLCLRLIWSLSIAV